MSDNSGGTPGNMLENTTRSMVGGPAATMRMDRAWRVPR